MPRIILPLLGFLMLSCSGSTETSGSPVSPKDGGQGGSPQLDATTYVDQKDASTVDGVTPDAGLPDVVGEDAADAADATTTGRARCGAAAYEWLAPGAMGDVLEKHNKAGHTQVDLYVVMAKLKNDDKIKTKRWPKYNTEARLIRYQTQDRGKLIDATALVTAPSTNNGTYPILMILHGTSGFSDQCSPTLGMKDGSLGGFSDDLGMLMSMYASFGFITVFPDYIGMKSLGEPTGFMHPYLIAEPTAIASLDAARAAKKMYPAGGDVVAGDVVVIGGSQGGHAAAFVNRYAPHYAPDLLIKGSAWDVPPTDMMEQTRTAWGTSWIKASDNAIAFFAAAQSWYASAPGGLSEVLLAPHDTQVPQELMAKCSGMKIDNPTLETVVTSQARAAAKAPEFGGFEPWACFLRENSLSSTSVPKNDTIPSLFLLGEMDDLVSNPVERAAFGELCAQGHQLAYLECAGASHTKPLLWAFDQTLDFLEARLRGEPMPADTCQLKPAERCTSQP